MKSDLLMVVDLISFFLLLFVCWLFFELVRLMVEVVFFWIMFFVVCVILICKMVWFLLLWVLSLVVVVIWLLLVLMYSFLKFLRFLYVCFDKFIIIVLLFFLCSGRLEGVCFFGGFNKLNILLL